MCFVYVLNTSNFLGPVETGISGSLKERAKKSKKKKPKPIKSHR